MKKKAPFHCTDCDRDFQTKAALIAHEKLAAVHRPLKPKPLIDRAAVVKLRNAGMPWREIARRFGVSLGGVRNAYATEQNHQRKKAACSPLKAAEPKRELFDDLAFVRHLRMAKTELERDRDHLIDRIAAIDAAIEAFTSQRVSDGDPKEGAKT